MDTATHTIDVLKNLFPAVTTSEFRGQVRAVAPVERIDEVLTFLKSEGIDLLVDITCVDYLRYRGAADRFGLAYILANTETNERLIVRTFVNEPDPTVPSATPLWEGANWMEREVWDMF